jgi:hypothetical protein
MSTWQGKHYDLVEQSCIDFVRDLAGRAGFTLPGRRATQTPTEFLQELKNMNGG